MAEIDLRSAEQIVKNQIPNGLPGEAMRKSMENKNILAEKGSLYVGTGLTETVNISGDAYEIAKTDKLVLPENSDGMVLVADSNSDLGLSYKNIASIGGVLYNQVQRITSDQQALARANIGAAHSFVAAPNGGIIVSSGSDSDFISLKAATETEIGGIRVYVGSSLPETLYDGVFYFVTT